jgi:hypothetical protein
LQNKDLLRAFGNFPLVRWFGQAWKFLSDWFRGANRQLSAVVRRGIKRFNQQRAAATPQIFRRFFNLSRLSPRDKIIHYYLSLIQLGNERGIDRRPSQTPYQYENRLKDSIPEIDQELHNLTDTFIEARYSRHPLEEPNAEQAGSLWEQIKAALKNWHKKDD